ncbi:hypothetical protein GQX73_g354 [Xylaria multiplex]|uniref:Uncharacterized protein n=1 Tax=Xylaria multiplex TaxID=323545 RepID=A0A7C8N1F3_9PEZI|nr:hypothetical protein GQX73_g354 [Xylaria multiplex]
MSLSNRSNTALVTSLQDIRVVALVFYGRKEFRNLRGRGGLLDAVTFTVKTDSKTDLDYLEELLRDRPCYSKFCPAEKTHDGRPPQPLAQTGIEKLQLDWWSNSWGKFDGWVSSWGAVSEPETIYIKIDDDIVFIDDHTIPALVKRTLDNPQYFGVSANVVNGGAVSWLHYCMGVFEPYWPESEPSIKLHAEQIDGQSPTQASWRASQLPSYTGPPEGPHNFNLDGSTPAPFEGHRWLPVRNTPDENAQQIVRPSPASTLTFSAWGTAVTNWAVAAQAHYSFLHHLEQGDTWRYKFNTWNFNYERLAINFIAIRGKDIMSSFPFPQDDDEEYLTCTRPKELGRPVVVDGNALVSHFAFALQRQPHNGRSIMWTDALARYQAPLKRVAWDPGSPSPKLYEITAQDGNPPWDHQADLSQTAGLRSLCDAYPDSLDEVSSPPGEVWALPILWNAEEAYVVGLIIVTASDNSFRRVGYFSSLDNATCKLVICPYYCSTRPKGHNALVFMASDF